MKSNTTTLHRIALYSLLILSLINTASILYLNKTASLLADQIPVAHFYYLDSPQHETNTSPSTKPHWTDFTPVLPPEHNPYTTPPQPTSEDGESDE